VVPVTVRRSSLKADSEDPVAGFFADVDGFNVTEGSDGDGDETDAPRVGIADLDPASVRAYVGIAQVEFDAVAKRKSRKPLTPVELAERARVATRFREVLDQAYRSGRRTLAVKLLCEVYGTSDVVLAKLRSEGRLA
jgi:hypothetical protein